MSRSNITIQQAPDSDNHARSDVSINEQLSPLMRGTTVVQQPIKSVEITQGNPMQIVASLSRGIKGDQGIQGVSIASVDLTSSAGLVDTYTITYSDATTTSFNITNGNSIASIQLTSTLGLVDTYTITYLDASTSTFDVTNGYTPEITFVGTVIYVDGVAGPDLKGEKGDTGDQGIQGIQGIKGDKGDQGIQGIQGEQGIQGIQGATGADSTVQGPKGDTGDTGPQGAKGDKGDQGIQGIPGAKGDQGDTGSTGATGSSGANGTNGIDGTNGVDGINGVDGRGVVSVTLTGTAGLVDTYTILYTDATTSTFDVTNGSGGGGGASVSISDTPPSTPSVGDLWFDSVSGGMYVWYDDGDSTQWVATSASGAKGDTGADGATGIGLDSATTDTEPLDTDEVYGLRSAATYIKTTWTTIKTFLKTYFDTIYQALGISNLYHGVVSRSTVSPLPTHLTTTTFTLACATTSLQYYYKGKLVTVSTDKTCSVSTGKNWIYFASDTGTLSVANSFPDQYENVLVATVTWNGADYGLVSDERHGYRRNIPWHLATHEGIGVRYVSGGDFTFTGTTNTNTTFSITATQVDDEDIAFADSGAFTTARILYQTGASTYAFLNTLNAKPYWGGASAGNGIYAVNASTFAQLTITGSNRYFNYFVYHSTDVLNPIYVLAETTATTAGYTSVANARAVSPPQIGATNITSELKLMYRIVVNGAGLIQTPIASDDYRSGGSIPGGGIATTSHNTLSNLELAGTGVAYGHISDQAQTIAGAKTFTDGVVATITGTASGNAVLDSVQTWTKGQAGEITALTSSSASIAINLSDSNNFSHTLTENTTLAAPSNPIAGQSGAITFTQHASSPKTLAYNTFWKFSGGVVPTLTASNSAVDVFTYYCPTNAYAVCSLIKAAA